MATVLQGTVEVLDEIQRIRAAVEARSGGTGGSGGGETDYGLHSVALALRGVRLAFEHPTAFAIGAVAVGLVLLLGLVALVAYVAKGTV